MTGMKILVGVLIPYYFLSIIYATPVSNKLNPIEKLNLRNRQKRSSPHLIEECLLVGVEEGTYFYKSKGSPDVCGLYLVSEPDQRIEVWVDYLNVDCDSGGIVTFLDGWEMSGEIFPPMDESNMESRVTNFCGHVRKRHLVTSSNAATILYKTPKLEDGFKITVNFVRHPKPCNILLTSDAEIVTLRNHGMAGNCTLATAFPASIKIIQLSVGVEDRSSRTPHRDFEMGILTRCHKRGYQDLVIVGGSPGLDTSSLHVEELFCGLDSNPRVPWSRVLCDVTGVRLVSSGRYDNSVTVAVTPLTSLEELPTTMCEAVV
ncbi:UNVERIFIED_CONTAM: hypothetical protein RMT77_009878 [Armadillidium vulgare]